MSEVTLYTESTGAVAYLGRDVLERVLEGLVLVPLLPSGFWDRG